MTVASHESCIQACLECARACDECFAACLREAHVGMMAECIRLDRECAEFCRMAAALLQRDSEFANDFCGLCAEVCRACGAECDNHNLDHCRHCAEMCQRCAQECGRMVSASV
jgi:hypothetical protein